MCIDFNPRLREGGDVLWILLWILWITISIHASAKEATFPLYLLWMGKRFQSTPPRRRRQWLVVYTDTSKEFQSTPPRRRRPDFLFFLHGHDYFNPRLREGGDGFYWSKHCKRCLISIHASAKEATFEHLLYVLDEHIFQSTPPRRRRPQHIVIPQLSCTYLVSTTFLSTFFSFISQYVVLFFLF